MNKPIFHIFVVIFVNLWCIVTTNVANSVNEIVEQSENEKCDSRYLESLKSMPVCDNSVQRYYCTSKVREEEWTSSYYGKKNAYIFVKPSPDREVPVEDTQPTNIFFVVRHGARQANRKTVDQLRHLEDVRDEILEAHKTRNSTEICESDLEKLRQWEFDTSNDNNSSASLTLQGVDEMKSLAHTYHRLFPNLVTTNYTKQDFHFRYTKTQRVQDSFTAFATELFGEDVVGTIDVSMNNTLLKPFEFTDFATEWSKNEKSLELPDSEVKKFEASAYAKIINELSALLAINRSLTVDEIESIYDTCRFDEAANPSKRSIWCSILSIDHFDILQYKEDITEYYVVGNGFDINRKIECDLVHDMIARLDSPLKVTGYFGHSKTLLLLFTALGAFEDPTPLTADNYDKLSNRQWRTSSICPFAANLAVVKYPGNKVKFLVNERVYKFDWCDAEKNELEDELEYAKCDSKYLDSLKSMPMIRHGTRQPSRGNDNKLRELDNVRDEILEAHKARNSTEICESDLEKFRQWQFNSSNDNNITGSLTPQGENELKSLAYTYHRLFPNLISRNYTKDDFLFQYTKTQRTQESFKAFAGALFGKDAVESIDASMNNSLLRPFETTPEWKEMEKSLDLPDSEIKKFDESDEWKKIIAELGDLLAINRTLTVDETKSVYDMCRFEEAFKPCKRSIWCAILSIEHFRIFEYREDLHKYYHVGHGSDINRKLECGLVQDMIARLDSQLKVTGYFAHAETLMLLFTALGAFEDPTPLRADNYETMSTRAWKTSDISPFAANLAVVKYPGDKVKFLLNEKVYKFDWCDAESDFCDWNIAKEKFAGRCNK
ncbi:Multiple inositol polyphosphate phosphatase 1 [Pseudolycoriella hygida]|uniref:Multiple inositol polyphosphate phosphatase 1 n=1 Tax=Pseudolycoriella hygida TaxID=35572 RepID=A0A9Q0S3J7_9DIPT|nr:Multiple inositol polyphosphate phosphatase 1 [Pseudolycoriella hygida]